MKIEKTFGDLLEEIRDAIREREIAVARGVGGWHWVSVDSHGRVSSGRETSPCYSEAEYCRLREADITVWAREGFDCWPRDSWEWNELDDIFDEHSEDAEILDAAIEAAKGWINFLACGACFEWQFSGGRKAEISVWHESDGKFYWHDYSPHDWEPVEIDAETQSDIRTLCGFSEEEEDAAT